MSAPARRQMADEILNEMLLEGDLEGVISYVENWNRQPRNQHDRIVFRYMSLGEFDNRLHPDGDFAQALPFDKDGNFVVKFITPDIYASSQGAKADLALPAPPDIAVWTFESVINATKMPAGPGNYQPVKPRFGEPGGGREATILQPFPIHGFFPLLK